MPETREFQWLNNGTSELAEDIIAGDTVIEVVNGALFPSPASADEIATVILRDVAEGKFEIMNITSRSGNFLTVERGAEGTTADNWVSGTKIRHGVTAAFFDRFISRSRRVRFVEADTYSDGGPQVSTTISLTPALPSAIEGDMIIAYMIVRGRNPDSAQPTAAEWNKLTIGDWGFGDGIFAGLNSGAPVLAAFRFVEANDTNPAFTFVTGDTDSGYAMIFSLYRNVSQLRPISQRVIRAGVMELESQNAFSPPPDMVRASPSSLSLNFFYGISNTSASYGPHDGIQPYKTAQGEAKEEFVLAFGSSGQYRALYLAAIDDSEETLDNLFPYSAPNMVGQWSTVNASISLIAEAGVDQELYYNRLTLSASTTGRHEAYEDVDLVAGQEYTFIALVLGDGSTDIPYHYFTVDDGIAERGVIGQATTVVKQLQRIGAGFDYCGNVQPINTSSFNGHQFVCVFTANVTGSHRFRIGGSEVHNSVESTFGVGTRRMRVYQTLLTRGVASPMPGDRELETDGYPLVGIPTARRGFMRGQLNDGAAFTDRIELNCKFGTPNPVRLVQIRYSPLVDFAPDRKSIIGNGYVINNGVGIAVASCPVHYTDSDVLGEVGKRFYFELLITVFVGTTASFAIGYSPVTEEDTSDATGVSPNGQRYMYRNDGAIFVNEIREGTTVTFTLGDVLGAEIDFTNNVIRFYKNGVEVGDTYDVDIATSHRRTPMRARIDSASSAGSYRAYQARFGADIQYLPAGCLAYDWQNA
jgi:hypothetical protein